MKARERKRERLVARYAAKRKALKDAGDWDAIAEAAEELFSGAFAQPLPAHGTSPWVYASIRLQPCDLP